MITDLARLAERRIRAAQAEGQLGHLAGEGKPLPDHPEAAMIDPIEAIGFRIMHEAGFVPRELELGKALEAAHAAWRATANPGEKARLMRQIADLETRRNIARETRLHLMHQG